MEINEFYILFAALAVRCAVDERFADATQEAALHPEARCGELR